MNSSLLRTLYSSLLDRQIMGASRPSVLFTASLLFAPSLWVASKRVPLRPGCSSLSLWMRYLLMVISLIKSNVPLWTHLPHTSLRTYYSLSFLLCCPPRSRLGRRSGSGVRARARRVVVPERVPRGCGHTTRPWPVCFPPGNLVPPPQILLLPAFLYG